MGVKQPTPTLKIIQSKGPSFWGLEKSSKGLSPGFAAAFALAWQQEMPWIGSTPQGCNRHHQEGIIPFLGSGIST